MSENREKLALVEDLEKGARFFEGDFNSSELATFLIEKGWSKTFGAKSIDKKLIKRVVEQSNLSHHAQNKLWDNELIEAMNDALTEAQGGV